jgi:hypothetical protein
MYRSPFIVFWGNFIQNLPMCFLPHFGSFDYSVSEEKIFFRNQPISNTNYMLWPCSLTDRDEMGRSWPCSYGSLNYNYLCNQCLSPLMLWLQISIRARCTTLYDKVCKWLATGRWFSPSSPVFSTNNTYCHDITEILLKAALNTIK